MAELVIRLKKIKMEFLGYDTDLPTLEELEERIKVEISAGTMEIKIKSAEIHLTGGKRSVRRRTPLKES